MAEQKADVHVVDMAILATPQTKRNGFKVLGVFTLLVRPLRIERCRLVRAPDDRFLVWTPIAEVKIAKQAWDEIAEQARQEYVAAIEKISA